MASSARIDELRKKFEENPRRYFAPLANEYRKSGQIDQAIAICREYLPQQPGHMSGHIVYGQALYEARQFDEAKTVFETALSLDPENLIALRHLGDIALTVGDGEGARGWYRRVLEADPRNEEIQAQLAKLDQGVAPADASSAPAAGAPAPAASAPPPKPTPTSAPTVVMAAVRHPAQPAPPAPPSPATPTTPAVTADSPTAEIRLETAIPHRGEPQEQLLNMVVDLPTTSAADSAMGAQPSGSAAGMPPQPALELESPVGGASSEAAPPIDGFSLAGLETTSLAAPEPAPPPQPPPVDLDFGTVAAEPPAAPAPAPIPDLDFGMASAPAARSAPESVAELPVPELIDLGEPASVEVASAPPRVPEIPEIDLSELGAPTAASASSPPAPLPAAPPSLEEMSLHVDGLAPAAPAPESGPFVTETMAELYLQQGHREEALRVYRALLEQRPGDATLQARVSTLQAEFAQRAPQPSTPAPRPAAAPQPPPSRARPAAAAPARSGPTIREILRVVAMRRPGYRPEPPGHNGSAPAEPAHAAPVMSRSFEFDAIGSLFGGTPISAENEAAATMLALAFSDLNGHESAVAGVASSEIAGEPAHRAPNELSLDTVFGANEAPPPSAPSNFSFDQFFSQRAAAEQASAGAPGEPGVQSQEDVAQFTQWLEGLKQR